MHEGLVLMHTVFSSSPSSDTSTISPFSSATSPPRCILDLTFIDDALLHAIAILAWACLLMSARQRGFLPWRKVSSSEASA